MCKLHDAEAVFIFTIRLKSVLPGPSGSMRFSFTCFLPAFLHACRALAVCAVITGFFGGVLTLIGMKCTKIGGSELANSRVTFAGAVTYLVSGK